PDRGRHHAPGLHAGVAAAAVVGDPRRRGRGHLGARPGQRRLPRLAGAARDLPRDRAGHAAPARAPVRGRPVRRAGRPGGAAGDGGRALAGQKGFASTSHTITSRISTGTWLRSRPARLDGSGPPAAATFSWRPSTTNSANITATSSSLAWSQPVPTPTMVGKPGNTR